MAIKVLLVEEDAAQVERLKTGFGAAGGEVELTNAISGPRAIGIAKTLRPDVIVVDGELEGLDGYAMTQQLKADPDLGSIPVVILATQPSEATALRARQSGATAHLPVAVDPGILLDKICVLAGAAGPSGSAPQSTAQDTTAPSEPMSQQPYGVPTPAPAASAPAAGGGAAPVREAPVSGYGQPAPVHEAAMGGSPGSVAVTSSAPVSGGDVPHVDDLLRLMIDRGGSDVHITVGSPPGIRIRGDIVPIEEYKTLTPKDTMAMLLSLLSEEQRKRFETELELDFAYSIPGLSRFRANIYQQRNSMGAVFRVIPLKIPTFEEIGLPKVCRFLAERPRGLVLVTGPTGSGKSTTLAAMINHINATKPLHIITMEDPIEFMHRNQKSYVNQREVGEDTHSFASALKRVLRQDPDVILVGEMRDLETISAAITAAETGHLVLATLHTTGGPETIDRIIDVFPPHQQQQVRMQLSNTLEGVLSQVLLRATDGRTRVMAMEIMLGIPAIRNLIREGKTHQMATIIQGGASLGMQTLDQHLKNLLQAGKITFEEAVGKASSPRELAQMVGRKI